MAETNSKEIAKIETVQTVTAPDGEAAGLQAGLKSLGFDSKLLVAQILNFVVLVLILRRFVYRPLVGLLVRRRHHIEESVRKAQDIDQRMKAWQEEQEKLLNKTKTESSKIITEAKAAAEHLRQQAAIATQAETARRLKAAQTEITSQKDRMMAELKHEVGQLAVAATGRILSREIDKQTQQRLAEQAVKEIR